MIRICAIIAFCLFQLFLDGQEEQESVRNYFYTNPFLAGINTATLSWEHRNGQNSFSLTGGYVYRKNEGAIKGFGYSPNNYIIMNTLWAYSGIIFSPGYNHYLRKNPDAWLGLKGLAKYMYHGSLDVPWEWKDAESFIRRIQSDRMFVAGMELLFGVKTDFAKHFYYEIFTGVGIRIKLHSMTVYDSYIETHPDQHPDPSYPFSQEFRLIRPTVHLGINLGLKI